MKATQFIQRLAVLTSLFAMVSIAHADRMTDNKNFTMTNEGDHLHFSLQMADAYRNNTFCTWGGILCTSGSNSKEIIILYSGDGDDDAVEDAHGPLDQVEMPKGQGIEGPRVHGNFFHSFCPPPPAAAVSRRRSTSRVFP